ncbi:MAG TPA: cupin domain-containing protein [Candidatus Limnocylindria bacterium]|nr:cupin domain-containing protein [Candidatus Limnocylindria bacterium]
MSTVHKIVSSGEGVRINVLGDNQLVKLTGAETGGSVAVIEQCNPPGTGIPLHVHTREDEIFHVLEGRMEFAVNGKAVEAGPGTTVFLPRNLPHAFKVVGDGPARVALTVIPAGVETMFFELSQLPPGPPDMARVVEICGRHGISFL